MEGAFRERFPHGGTVRAPDGRRAAPTGRDLAGWTAGVSVFVLTLMLMVTGMDLGLGGLVLLVFG